MVDLLEKAMERVRSWSPARQVEVAELLMALDDLGLEPIELSDDELAAVDEALAQLERGETADSAEVEALFSRFRA